MSRISHGRKRAFNRAGAMRIEKDSIGEFPVPAGAYWGINAGRAAENFPISGRKINPRLIAAYCRIKKAAAVVNMRTGQLSKAKGKAIIRAAEEVLSGGLRDQFIVDRFQAGAGTSTNMNVNEVLCNRALELLGQKKGRYDILSPNDHLNMGQSTNDTYPAAAHLAALAALEDFEAEAARLAASLSERGKKFSKVLKSGRTHLQDAVPVLLGREFSAYAAAVRASARHIRRTAADLNELGIGGSAAGTGMNTHPAFARRMAAELSRSTGFKLRKAADLMHAMQSQAPLGRVSSAMRDFAVELGRIANDLRLLSSGPATGLAEIRLPAVQAGSSIMPGKVNPSVPEMVNMVCFHAVGGDLSVSLAAAAGQLELNVMMPLMAENLLESIDLLAAACRQLALRCVGGITADAARCRDYAGRSMGLATALAPEIGYLAAAGAAKRALASGKSIAGLAEAEGLLSPGALARLLDPVRLTRPGAGKPRR
ncbi:MAG: aspartate ammonia-lyase [Elusimicrobiales bacterium]|nr:aspartate ammonia-lyase [Elusimicrobiales bacterium]